MVSISVDRKTLAKMIEAEWVEMGWVLTEEGDRGLREFCEKVVEEKGGKDE